MVDDYAAAIAVVMVLPYHPPIERGAFADAGLDIAGDAQPLSCPSGATELGAHESRRMG